MKKETMAEKMARKSFESAQFQQSWMVHMQAFGPILERAFAENYQAKIHLCAALNHISRKQLSQGLAKLKLLEKFIENDADKCAYLFFMGVYCDMAGNQEQMIAMYTLANEYGHKLYLPYLKVAKFYINGHMYETGEKNCRAAIDCFTATGLSPRDKLLLGSAYSNLGSCLLMMHRYAEAEEALTTSRSLFPNAPGRAAVEAALYALRGEAEKVNECLETLKGHAPAAYEAVKESTGKMLDKTDPKFFPVALEEGKIAAFWGWFGGYSAELNGRLARSEYEAAVKAVAEKLLEAFPFLEEVPPVALGRNEEGWVIRLTDMYAVAVMDAYEKLLAACPEEIKAQWQFDVVHE